MAIRDGVAGRGVTQLEVADADGQRIDNYLLRHLKGVPRSRVYSMLRRGEVRVDGRRVKPGYRVKKGEILRIPPVRTAVETDSPSPPAALATLLEERVLFEDEGLLALDKPQGVAVHGGSGIRLGVIETLRVVRGDPRLELAHRLDRGTSGVLLIAKNRPALSALHAVFRDRAAAKHYEALVIGVWPSRIRTVRRALARYVSGSGERRVRLDAGGQAAVTDFDVRMAGSRLTWMDVRPRTGRTHQIRVHSAGVGHPVLGDDKYGGPNGRALAGTIGVQGLCLHARRLRIPWRGERLTLDAPTPARLHEAWHAVEDDGPG